MRLAEVYLWHSLAGENESFWREPDDGKLLLTWLLSSLGSVSDTHVESTMSIIRKSQILLHACQPGFLEQYPAWIFHLPEPCLNIWLDFLYSSLSFISTILLPLWSNDWTWDWDGGSHRPPGLEKIHESLYDSSIRSGTGTLTNSHSTGITQTHPTGVIIPI